MTHNDLYILPLFKKITGRSPSKSRRGGSKSRNPSKNTQGKPLDNKTTSVTRETKKGALQKTDGAAPADTMNIGPALNKTKLIYILFELSYYSNN